MKRRSFLKNAALGISGLVASSQSGIGAVSKRSGRQENGFKLERSITRDSEYDVVITGGGMAGAIAAIAAGRTGARTLIIENMGSLGGMATNGYVCAWDSMADGEKNIIGGIMLELTEAMFANGGMPEWADTDSWRKNYLHPTRIKPEVLRRLLDQMVVKAGVEIRYFTKLVDVESDRNEKKVNGIIVAQAEGLRYIPARCFIDTTGDAQLCAFAGADYWQAGRDSKTIMPPTLCSMYTGSKWTDIQTDVKEKYNQAVADGFFAKNNEAAVNQFIISRLTETMFTLNAGHIYFTDGVNTSSVTNAMIEGRKMAEEYARFMRKYLPGYEKVELSNTASLPGIRESRRIIGEYTLTIDDFKNRRHFPDQIGVFNKEVDIHPYEPSVEANNLSGTIAPLKPGETYGLPYGMIVPKGWKNLWAAGRCASGDSLVYGSYRVMPSAAMLGQAAGMAAIQAINNKETANNLNTETLIKTLRAMNAYLPQEKLSEKMTRN